MGLCFFQSDFWQSVLQYQTVEHLEHFLEAGFSHRWQVRPFSVVAGMGDNIMNKCDARIDDALIKKDSLYV
jgi:hypothetical protein